MFLGVMAAMFLLPVHAFAAGSIDPDQNCSLNIFYHDGDEALTNVTFSIYRVASVDASGELTPTEEFDSFNVKIRGKNDEAWRTLASTLEGYVLRDKVTPTFKGTTDRNGKLYFPNENKKLPTGLYLVLGSRRKQSGATYEAQPFMIMLPTQDKATGNWKYDMTVNPKHESIDGSKPSEPVTRKVLKVWKDGGSGSGRPTEIVVDLLQDGELYDSVTLSADNNWRYTWEDLDGDSKWNLVEADAGDYTVEIKRAGVTFVVTNTSTVDVPDNETPKSSPPSSNSGGPNSGGPNSGNPEIDIPDSDTPRDSLSLGPNKVPLSAGPRLPQTGQLWWPVPVLLFAGMLLIVMGLLCRRGIENEK